MGAPDTIDSWTQKANDPTINFKMIRGPRPDPAADANEANLLAWLYDDEPDLAGESGVMGAQAFYGNLHPRIPARPVMINLTGAHIYDPSDTCNGPGDNASDTCYHDFIANEDWVSEDSYPVYWFDGDLPALGRVYDKLRRWSKGKPQFGYIELTAIKRNGITKPQPTPDQVRAEIWSSIVHGARGLFYFPHGGCDPCTTNDGVPPNVAAEVTGQNTTIKNLAAILQTAINPPGIGVDAPAPLDAGWRVDSQGSPTVIVVNMSLSTITKTITLCGVTPTMPITVYGENRGIGSAGVQTFTDTFGPGARHIYLVHGSPITSSAISAEAETRIPGAR